MSRSKKKARLSLYERGNDRCPICLSKFSERDVEEGITVTLEHVPPRSVAPEISLGMCLTCVDCNNDADGGVDQAAAKLTGRQKARVDIQGFPHTAYFGQDGSIKIRGRPEISEESFVKAFEAGETFNVSYHRPQIRYANVSWLKSAYLTVFSLLGRCGYIYAEGSAIRQVREQILKPTEDIICNYAMKTENQGGPDGVLMNRKKRPCWAVKMGQYVVLLPSSRDDSFYSLTKVFGEGNGELGDGPLFFPSKFGKNIATSVEIRDADGVEKAVGADLFGRNGEISSGGKSFPFVVVDYNRQYVSVLFTSWLN